GRLAPMSRLSQPDGRPDAVAAMQAGESRRHASSDAANPESRRPHPEVTRGMEIPLQVFGHAPASPRGDRDSGAGGSHPSAPYATWAVARAGTRKGRQGPLTRLRG